MKFLVILLMAGALVLGGGCKKKTPVPASLAVTNQVEQAAVPAPQPTAAPRQNIPAPAAAPAGGAPKKLPMVP